MVGISDTRSCWYSWPLAFLHLWPSRLYSLDRLSELGGTIMHHAMWENDSWNSFSSAPQDSQRVWNIPQQFWWHHVNKYRHCSRKRSYRVARAATGPGEVIPHWERREETWTNSQAKDTQLSLSVPRVGWEENQTKFDITVKEIWNSYFYNTTPISRGNQHQTKPDQNRTWPGTSSCRIYVVRYIIWPLPAPSLFPVLHNPRGWRPRKGEGKMCAFHVLFFHHPEVMLRPVLQGGEKASFKTLWNWTGLLISKSDKKGMESAEDTAKKQEIEDLSEHSLKW